MLLRRRNSLRRTQQLGVSRRTIVRLRPEAPVVGGGDDSTRRAGRVGRPAAAETVRARMAALLSGDPDLPPGAVWQVTADGFC